ncbi:MAG: transposase, partial [Planctomycetaceae bacterium]|nr:transposase [Planctomycetaceae bacterium]
MVVAFASLTERKSINKVIKLYGNRRTRQAIMYFLTEAEWNAPEVLLENSLTILRRLVWKSGDAVSLVIDDTQKQKRAKQRDSVSKIWLHAEKTYAHGPTILGCAFVYRGVVVPCALRLWASKDYCRKSQKSNNVHEPVKFKTLTELAADC